jgi:hypothetical protein
MSERRDPSRQRPDPDGDRADDPVTDRWLTIGKCAQRLGVSTGVIRGEIQDGRLLARIQIQRPHKRTIYRILESDLTLYLRQYNWRATNTPCARKA